ncbi:hypothetical protein MTR_6g033770 [Medicago truncatula]|uniref:RNA recognition motif n=1 Tax=Medicago truncatula TaxID=3880 RepID=A0A072U7I6_MEDTR|nr:hypothetical protein MTR_6g033770 [Medicago truncatula]
MPVFRLRQFFEVCGILSDVYIARQLNSCSQVYGLVRFEYVKNRDKLEHALNNISIGDFRVWAPNARFDRFAQHDEEVRVSRRGDGKDGVVTPVVLTHGNGVKNVRVGKMEGEERDRQEKKIERIATVDVHVGKRKKKNKSKKLKIKKEKECEAEGEVGKKDENRVEEGKKVEERKQVWISKVEKVKDSDIPRPVENLGMLLYNSKPEDRLWANGSMVLKVVNGDS